MGGFSIVQWVSPMTVQIMMTHNMEYSIIYNTLYECGGVYTHKVKIEIYDNAKRTIILMRARYLAVHASGSKVYFF